MKKLLLFFPLLVLFSFPSCDFIKVKKKKEINGTQKKIVARVGNIFLYNYELEGLVPNHNKEDSIARIHDYIDSWVRKQLIMLRASEQLNVDEAEIQRRLLEYRYSLIGYQYQSHFINQHLDTNVSDAEIKEYFKANLDNFTLRQNIMKGAFFQLPLNAPNLSRIKKLLKSEYKKNFTEIKQYCLRYALAFHLDNEWIEFNSLVVNTPLMEIPDKISFLKTHKYYEITNQSYIFILIVNDFRISNTVTPEEFAKEEIRTIILNKRKVALAKKMENDIYESAQKNNEFEIFEN